MSSNRDTAQIGILLKIFVLLNEIEDATGVSGVEEAMEWAQSSIREHASDIDWRRGLQMRPGPIEKQIASLTRIDLDLVAEAATAVMDQTRARMVLTELQRFKEFRRIGASGQRKTKAAG